MARTVAIGIQDFEKIIDRNCFYVDKTDFIRQWWESDDEVTLIARPRRFGKTLNMSMLETFFSNKYENRGDLFEHLEIWKYEEYRKLQGTYPVMFLSFANIKEQTYEHACQKIMEILIKLYSENDFLLDSDILKPQEKEFYRQVTYGMDVTTASLAIHHLSDYLSRYYGKKVIILLDEYDTPMQEAYVNGYWQKFTLFIRNLFNATFKTNPYLERAIMTGITRVSRESVFSDLNNLEVVTTTSDKYATAFGFTEEEVFCAMEEQKLADKLGVKWWYDGFTFGNVKDIYNPWSIINYLDKKKFTTYWANTSSNGLVGKLIREGNPDIKTVFEKLLRGEQIEVPVNEQIVYNELDMNETAIWSLLLATGYLKVINYQTDEQSPDNEYPLYQLAITNEEVRRMFYRMVSGWFGSVQGNYNAFIKALIQGDLDAMNEYMERVTRQIFSSFDTGGAGSRADGMYENSVDSGNIAGDESAAGIKKDFSNRKSISRKSEPERFYHGFVLGLMVDMSKDYIIKSNRESGFGRYDIMIYPKDVTKGAVAERDGIIIEFKVRREKKEASLEETVREALRQIEKKNYAAELNALGFTDDHIRKYGFAFDGKQVLIGDDKFSIS